MSEMTSRQRVLAALDRQEPDRVPIDIGGALCSISQFSYRRLLEHLGWEEEIVIGGLLTQVVKPSDRILELLGSDFIHLFAGPPDVKLGRNLEGSMDDPFDTYLSGEGKRHTFMDEWGVTWRRSAYYYDMIDFPLKGEVSLKDLESYRWPDPKDAGRFRGLKERAKAAHESGKIVTLDPLAGGILEMASSMRGHQDLYADLVVNLDFAEAMLDGIVSFFEDFYEAALTAAHPYIDIVFFGDDYGMQNNMIISPKMWRKMIKPGLARLIQKIKSVADVKFQHHSCGAIKPIIGDLAEIGVDILNPVQPTAAGMDLPEIKKEFGEKLVLHGAVDQQEILPYGAPEEVAEEMKRRINQLAPGGGFVVAVSPNIQADVPPENILTLFQTARHEGRYPLGRNGC